VPDLFSFGTFLTFASGGLGGAVVTQWVKPWLDRPILALDFDLGIDGCERRYIDFGYDDGYQCQRKYLRLRVRNTGRSAAKDVRVIVAAISGAIAFRDEVFDVRWSRGTVTGLDIPSRTYRFVDICHTDYEPRERWLRLFGDEEIKAKIDELSTIEFEVYVTAANAATREQRIEVQTDGTAERTTIVRRSDKPNRERK
jgi:hypothetical protein